MKGSKRDVPMNPEPCLSGSALSSRHGGPEGLRSRPAADAGRPARRRGGHQDRVPGEEQAASGELGHDLNFAGVCFVLLRQARRSGATRPEGEVTI